MRDRAYGAFEPEIGLTQGGGFVLSRALADRNREPPQQALAALIKAAADRYLNAEQAQGFIAVVVRMASPVRAWP